MKRLELAFMRVPKPSSNPGARNAFTLIEVMIAAILISVVGLSLLQMHHNSTQMGYKMQNKFKYSDWVLMAAYEHTLEKTTKNTSFMNLSKAFNIDDREIRLGLNQKARIQSDLFQRISAADMMGAIEEESDEVRPVYEGLHLEVYQQKISMDHETYTLFRIIKP